MRFSVAAVLLCLLCAPSWADWQAPQHSFRPVTDPANVVNDRGSKLEVFPTQRAAVVHDLASGSIKHQVTTANTTAPIGPRSLGVVFNHAMQQTGYISGEISFKPKPGFSTKGLSTTEFPGLKHLDRAGIYVVQTTTPTQFMDVMKKLQARKDVEWVEPTVTYGNTVKGASAAR
jgi:hypothetical protein